MYNPGEIILVSNLEDGVYSKRIFVEMSDGESLIEVVKPIDVLNWAIGKMYETEYFSHHKKDRGKFFDDFRKIRITAIPDFAQKTKPWYRSYTILCIFGMLIIYLLDYEKSIIGTMVFLIFTVGAILFRIDADEKLI